MVGDDVAGLEVTVADVLEQARPLPLHRALVHAERKALVHGVAELDRTEERPVGTDHGDRAPLAYRIDRPVQGDRRPTLKLELRRGHVLKEVSVRLRADRVD